MQNIVNDQAVQIYEDVVYAYLVQLPLLHEHVLYPRLLCSWNFSFESLSIEFSLMTLEAKFGGIKWKFFLIQNPSFIQFKLDFLYSTKQSSFSFFSLKKCSFFLIMLADDHSVRRYQVA